MAYDAHETPILLYELKEDIDTLKEKTNCQFTDALKSSDTKQTEYFFGKYCGIIDTVKLIESRINLHGKKGGDGMKMDSYEDARREFCRRRETYSKPVSDIVSSQSHYCEGREYEPRKVIMDWGLNFYLGNVVKHISRAGRKGDALEDLQKAAQYLQWEIERLGGKVEVEQTVDWESFCEKVNKARDEAQKRYADNATDLYASGVCDGLGFMADFVTQGAEIPLPKEKPKEEKTVGEVVDEFLRSEM